MSRGGLVLSGQLSSSRKWLISQRDFLADYDVVKDAFVFRCSYNDLPPAKTCALARCLFQCILKDDWIEATERPETFGLSNQLGSPANGSSGPRFYAARIEDAGLIHFYANVRNNQSVPVIVA